MAEELNFRRAAERLHLAQPVLSRQIRALEKELHAKLLVRDSSGAQLTEAGGQLLAEPIRALGAAHPELTVEVLRTDWTNQVTVPHDGRTDVGYVRMPVDLTGLQSLALFGEQRIAVLPTAHRLAEKK